MLYKLARDPVNHFLRHERATLLLWFINAALVAKMLVFLLQDSGEKILKNGLHYRTINKTKILNSRKGPFETSYDPHCV